MKNIVYSSRRLVTLCKWLVLPLLALCFAFQAGAQTTKISGKVSDASGPLAGASVAVKGTTIGALTGADGTYSIEAGSDATLVFSYMGYTTQEQSVKGRASIDVTLSAATENLDEVVVVGYGTQKKANLTGSVSTVTASKLESRATPNVSTALSGLAAGVTVRQGSGTPGDDGASIRIRGVGSFNSSDPLIIIDGATADLNSINPEDVETISLLKDAASASIYGSRGANGVVLVTTKKGNRNASPRVTYTGMFTQEAASTKFELMSSYADYMELFTRAQKEVNPTGNTTYSQASIDAWRAAAQNPDGNSEFTDKDGNVIPNWVAYPNTDWSDILFAPTYAHKHNVSVSGGSNNSSYLLSLGYFTNPGTLENTGIDRFNMRINAESQITKFLKIGTQTYAMKQRKDQGSLSSVNTYRFQSVPGLVPYWNGKYGAAENPEESSTANNLLMMVNNDGGQATTTRLNTTWYAGVNIVKGLSAEARINYQNYFYDNESYSKHNDGYQFRTGDIRRPGTLLTDATSYRAANRSDNYTATVTANYNATFAEDHDLNVMAGYEQYYYYTTGFNATKNSLIDFSVTDFTSAAEMKSMGGTAMQDYAMASYFGRVNYAFRGKYLFEANLRRDASSRFSSENRWGTFPSFSAGWRISEESFMESLKPIISNLKLRASWGQLGNVTSGYYDWQATYSKVNNVLGDVYNGLAVTKVANEMLQWESSTSSEIGLDASFLNQRLTLEANFYNRLTEGILTTPSMYLTMGTASAPTQNTADMRNRGVELSLGWNDKIGDFSYSVNANLAINNNMVTKYKGKLVQGWVENEDGTRTWKTNLGDVANVGNTVTLEDHPYNEYFLRTRYSGDGSYFNGDGSVNPNGGPRDGMIRTADDMKWLEAMYAAKGDDGKALYSFNGKKLDRGQAGLWYGEPIFADLNGDGNFGNDADRQFCGTTSSPKYGYGFTVAAAWKGIDFSMTWAGAGGFSYYILERGVNRNNINDSDALPSDASSKFYYVAYGEDGTPDWTNPANNLNAEYPRLRYGNTGTTTNDMYLYDATFLKLKMLQIGYTFPKAWMQKVHIGSLRVFASGENLLTFTSYPGVDPEMGSGVAVYPIARLLSLGVNLTF